MRRIRSLPPALALAALLTVASSLGAIPPAHQSGPQCCAATIRVRVPDGTDTVYLAGSLPQLGPWRPDGLAMAGAGRERNARVTAPPGTTFEYKFTLGSWNREALTPSGTVPPNSRLLLDRDTVVVHELAAFKRDPRDYIADWRGSDHRLVWVDLKVGG